MAPRKAKADKVEEVVKLGPQVFIIIDKFCIGINLILNTNKICLSLSAIYFKLKKMVSCILS